MTMALPFRQKAMVKNAKKWHGHAHNRQTHIVTYRLNRLRGPIERKSFLNMF